MGPSSASSFKRRGRARPGRSSTNSTAPRIALSPSGRVAQIGPAQRSPVQFASTIVVDFVRAPCDHRGVCLGRASVLSQRRGVLTGELQLKGIVRYLILITIALLLLAPIAWLFVSSLRPAGTTFEYTTDVGWRTWIPERLTWENFAHILANPVFRRAMSNSLFVALATVGVGVLVNSAAGFSFAVFDFPFKKALFALVLITFMMPFESIVIPLYVLIRSFGWTDTYYALIVPGIANGLVIFLFRQFLAGLPRSLYEAARVDGASWWQIYWKIALPLAWPTSITAGLLLFIQQWEAFFWPLVAASSSDYVVVQVAIARNITFEEAHWGRLFASTTAAVIVPMLLFLGVQRYYMRTVVSSAFK